MLSIAQTLKEILGVDQIRLTIRGKPLEPEARLAIINHVMDEMQIERGKILAELKDQF
jgi:hypothetical protein